MPLDGRSMPSQVDAPVERMRAFALGALSASSSVFYWISDELEMADVQLSGSSCRTFHAYQRDMKRFDPLNVARLVRSRRRVSFLKQDYTLAPEAEYDRYRGYLARSGIVDVLDFVFWDGDIAFAGFGVIKNPGDPPFGPQTPELAFAMHDYLEFNLSAHPRLARQRLERRLAARFGLTRREIEIAELVRQGLTNQDLGEELGIGLGTVKTHLARIFVKLGIENRASLSARLSQIGA
jgi:DNA-binding CsgD family transcriptional regulator